MFCPCALVLATPTAIMAAIGNVTRHSFLVREGGRPGAAGPGGQGGLRQDGHPDPRRARGDGGARPVPGVTEEQVYDWLARAELGSEHPWAKRWSGGGRPPRGGRPRRGLEALPGRGLRAVLDGHTVLAGSEALLEEAGAALPPTARAEAEVFRPRGAPSSIWRWTGPRRLLRPGGHGAGRGGGHAPGPERGGVSPVLLTGDNENAAAHIARTLSIREYRAGCLPEDKLNWIDRPSRRASGSAWWATASTTPPALKGPLWASPWGRGQ